MYTIKVYLAKAQHAAVIIGIFFPAKFQRKKTEIELQKKKVVSSKSS